MKRFISVILVMLLANAVVAQGKDADFEENVDCLATGEAKITTEEGSVYHIPRLLVANHEIDGEFFKDKDITEVMGIYSKEIDFYLNEYQKNKNIPLLHCALGLVETQEKLLSKWNVDARMNVLQKNNGDTTSLTVVEMVYDGYSNFICTNYNKIALKFEKNTEIKIAEEIYRQVLRRFYVEKFKGCFREAEISLQKIIPE